MKMKLTFIFLCLMLSIFFANVSMANEEMQQQMQEVQKCFESIDQSQFHVLEAKGKEMESEIKKLCAAGERDEAMKVGMKYGQELSSSPEMKEIRRCSQLMQKVMPNMPTPYMPPEANDDGSDGAHICDGM